MMIPLNSIFLLEYGSKGINSKSDLGSGDTPIISSQGVDNGCYGFFDVKEKYKMHVISVPRTGSIGEAFVQLHPCNIDDNCLVVIPKIKVSLEYLFYVATKIRNEKWRYLYGRQITPARLGKMQVERPNSFVCDVSYDNVFHNSIQAMSELFKSQFNCD